MNSYRRVLLFICFHSTKEILVITTVLSRPTQEIKESRGTNTRPVTILSTSQKPMAHTISEALPERDPPWASAQLSAPIRPDTVLPGVSCGEGLKPLIPDCLGNIASLVLPLFTPPNLRRRVGPIATTAGEGRSIAPSSPCSAGSFSLTRRLFPYE